MVEYLRWMGQQDDNTPISKLSIPGTHNSAACHIALPSVKCQDHTVSTQLKNGVRFFDIRLGKQFFKDDVQGQYRGKDLQVIHGKFPVRIPRSLKFSSVLNELFSFLDQNPSETCIVSIKQEGEDFTDNKSEFSQFVWSTYIEPYQDRWYLQSNVPRLCDARNKIVLFRRFSLSDNFQGQDYGIEAAWWPFSTPNEDCGLFQVQDFCELKHAENIKEKTGYVKQFLQIAINHNSTADAPHKLFFNFCSGANLYDTDCWPEKVAEEMLRSGLNNNLNRGCGIVILDYAGKDNWALVRQIVDSNF
ncbi:LANO_0H01420g1_1 [Lachancea nothofagi CBS 11611]|uniref:LANO_0H01420g1_1 n=1 Tax=Lachancea nothofagi CBS 11611 TaxID=1266666 RepID=A0A1G4KL25_9SACH|nr:LANO_0H01420g1_1 [Lachancea nothofagi CBS 11611]